MQNYKSKLKSFGNVKIFSLNDEKETSQKLKEIHSQRKGEDSPGSFRFKRTRKINKRTL